MTKSTTHRNIEDIFGNLNTWRHLPGFKLEEHAAPFFELFLPAVLEAHFDGVDIHPILIPEFPVFKRRIGSDCQSTNSDQSESNHRENNLHYRVDYVAFSQDCREVFIIELKTDMDSRRETQDLKLSCVEKLLFTELVSDIVDHTKSKRNRKRSKWVHLCHRLAQLDLIHIPNIDLLYRMTFPQAIPGWTEEFNGVILKADGKLATNTVVYIQPDADNESSNSNAQYIGFEEFASIAVELGDLGRLFAKYLLEWIDIPGSKDPR